MSAAHVAHAIFEHHAAASAEGAAAADRSDATDALLRKLLHVFTEKQLQRALALVDQRGVSCVVAEATRRTLFQVKGHTAGEVHTCFPGHYCCCQAFFFDVVSKAEEPYCKHQLAALVAHALRLCATFVVSDTEFARLLEAGLDSTA